MLSLKIHKNFNKDLKKIQLNPTNTQKMFLYISYLLNNQPLPKEAQDHVLKGDLNGVGEFHISGDLVILYLIEDNALKLLRIGSHSQVFK